METKSQYEFFWPSPVGVIHLLANDKALLRLDFPGDYPGGKGSNPDSPALIAAIAWLEEYFAGGRPDLTALPIDPAGTPFQKKVWRAVSAVNYGQTSSYGAIAAKIAAGSPRAVGQAIGRNPLAIIVPCHRILMSNGKLCGYAWGADIKLWLLRHEGVDI